jgi:hypothetical protein
MSFQVAAARALPVTQFSNFLQVALLLNQSACLVAHFVSMWTKLKSRRVLFHSMVAGTHHWHSVSALPDECSAPCMSQ